MGVLIGYDYWGTTFEDDSPSLLSIKTAEFGNSIIDEISLRSKTEQGTGNVRDTWQNDTHFIAKFANTLEAGNLDNSGVKIVKFRITRRLNTQDQNDDIYLGEVNYAGGDVDLSFTDVTNPNTDLVYTLIPIGENGLDGTPREVQISSDFCGVWIVDPDSKQVLVFDKAIGGNVGNVDSTHVQNRTQIDTFNQYPQFYYGQQNFESFTLTTAILPDDGQRTGKKYKEILDKFFTNHKPLIIKTDTGRIMVCDIGNVRLSSPTNTWENFDYGQLTVDVTEIMEYESFMKNS